MSDDPQDRAVSSYFGLPRRLQWLDEGSNDPWHINGLPLQVTTIGTVFDEALPQEMREDPNVSAALDAMHGHLKQAQDALYRALELSSIVRRNDAEEDER